MHFFLFVSLENIEDILDDIIQSGSQCSEPVSKELKSNPLLHKSLLQLRKNFKPRNFYHLVTFYCDSQTTPVSLSSKSLYTDCDLFTSEDVDACLSKAPDIDEITRPSDSLNIDFSDRKPSNEEHQKVIEKEKINVLSLEEAQKQISLCLSRNEKDPSQNFLKTFTDLIKACPELLTLMPKNTPKLIDSLAELSKQPFCQPPTVLGSILAFLNVSAKQVIPLDIFGNSMNRNVFLKFMKKMLTCGKNDFIPVTKMMEHIQIFHCK